MRVKLNDKEWVRVGGDMPAYVTIQNTGQNDVAYCFRPTKPIKPASGMNEDDYYRLPPATDKISFSRVEDTGLSIYAMSLAGVGDLTVNE